MDYSISAVVGVTGMNATDNPAPGVPVVRSLRADPAFSGRVIGLGYDPLDPGFYADGLLDAGALLPFPSAGRAAVAEKIRLLRREFGLEVILPTLDSELRVLAALEPELRASGIAMHVPDVASIEAVSKARLPALAERARVKVPDSEAIASPTAVARAIDRLGLPVVVKGVYYGATIASSEAEAIAAYHRYITTWGVPVIVQAHVRGEEYNVAALGDGTGRTVGAVAMRKMALTDQGKAWAGVTVFDQELLDTTGRIIRELRWRGGIEVELMRESGTGALHVMEINPRFPAWIHLATAAGQNLPSAAVRLALGDSVPTFSSYRVGLRFVRITLDQTGDLATFGALSTRGQIDFAEGTA